jgi:hypothetical protein
MAMFDGSVYPDRTRGEISAKYDKEAMNFLSLNLVNDIVTGKRSVQEARQFYGKTVLQFMQGIPSPYTQQFLFPRQHNTVDPDVPVLKMDRSCSKLGTNPLTTRYLLRRSD